MNEMSGSWVGMRWICDCRLTPDDPRRYTGQHAASVYRCRRCGCVRPPQSAQEATPEQRAGQKIVGDFIDDTIPKNEAIKRLTSLGVREADALMALIQAKNIAEAIALNSSDSARSGEGQKND